MTVPANKTLVDLTEQQYLAYLVTITSALLSTGNYTALPGTPDEQILGLIPESNDKCDECGGKHSGPLVTSAAGMVLSHLIVEAEAISKYYREDADAGGN